MKFSSLLFVLLLTATLSAAPDVQRDDRRKQVYVSTPEEVTNWKPTFRNLDDWAQWVCRPGFRLLLKTVTNGDFVAVFRTRKRNLAVMHFSPKRDVAAFGLYVTSKSGEWFSYGDHSHLSTAIQIDVRELEAGKVSPVKLFSLSDGTVVSIPKTYSGPIHVSFDVNYRKIYDRHRSLALFKLLDWTYAWK